MLCRFWYDVCRHFHVWQFSRDVKMKSRTNRRQSAQTDQHVIYIYCKIYVTIVVELPMYDFVTVILGTLLVQLFVILFGVNCLIFVSRYIDERILT